MLRKCDENDKFNPWHPNMSMCILYTLSKDFLNCWQEEFDEDNFGDKDN